MKKYLLAIILFSIVALWPFFKKGYFESHDGEWMVIRFSAFHQTFVAGEFPVRFVDRLNNNYGYPVLNFLYPLPFYLSEIPKIIGFNFVDSIKIVFIASTVVSALAMFWALSQSFSSYASLAGAIIYLFIPYRFVDLYVRGSLGENVAFAVAPLVLGSILKISNGQKKFLPILSVSIALLITSHNVVAILLIPLFFLISTLLIKKNIAKIVIIFLIGFSIAAFFWLPALYDLQFVRLSQNKISNIPDHLVSVETLIIPKWGYGPNPQAENGFSPQIGLVSIAIFFVSIFLFLRSKRKDPMTRVFLVVFALAFLLMTRFSLQFWQNFPFVDVIQFPWRLLSIVVFISALLTAFVIDSIKNKKLIAFSIISTSIISTIFYTRPLNFVDRGDGFYSTNEDTTTIRDEYLPLWVKQKPQGRANEKIQIDGSAEIISSEIKAANYKVTINAKDDAKVTINTVYFPGWQSLVDGKKGKLYYQDNPYGLMSFKLPKGTHEVIIKYGKTPVHLFSEIVSIVTLFGTGVYFFVIWRRTSF